jgi:hypothetical protein
MNKLKNLFSKPLVSSNSKISPWLQETSYQEETTKPQEIVTPQQIPSPQGRFLKKSHSFFPMPAPDRPKKRSLQPIIPKQTQSHKTAAVAAFDFEQFEELVDKKKLKHSRDKIDLNDENEKENKSAKARRHSWSSSDQTDQAISQHGLDILKKFRFPPENVNPTINTNMVASPTIRSPLNQSRTDEFAGLLDMGDSQRKDFCASPIELCEEPQASVKDRRKSSSARRKSERTASMTPQRGDREHIEAEGFPQDKRMSIKENKDEIFGPGEQEIGEDPDDLTLDNNSNSQRHLFKTLSARLALTQRFEEAGEKVPSIHDLGSSASNSKLDSLVEENPFEDEVTVRAKSQSVRY